jgi:hypothetical protein
MTHVHTPDCVGSDSPNVPRQTPTKQTLFCPRCAHESPVDGDWILTLRPEAVEIHCPDCRALLTRRPDRLATKERSAGSR